MVLLNKIGPQQKVNEKSTLFLKNQHFINKKSSRNKSFFNINKKYTFCDTKINKGLSKNNQTSMIDQHQ